jgi:hypothetical protein
MNSTDGSTPIVWNTRRVIELKNVSASSPSPRPSMHAAYAALRPVHTVRRC